MQFHSQSNVGIDSKALSRRPTCQALSIRLPLGVEGKLAGRCMILSDAELRSFKIANPWTKVAAEELGEQAVAAWDYEADTPPLDEGPMLSPGALRALSLLLRGIRGGEYPFSFDVWQAAATLGDIFARECGDLFKAAHAYVAAWRRTRSPSTMAPEGIHLFHGAVGNDVYLYSQAMAKHGVRPHGSSVPTRFRQQAYSCVDDDPVTTAAEICGDLVNGRLFLFTDISEDLTGNLMESKLTFAIQTDVANPDALKTRYISDPRFGRQRAGDGGNHPDCVIPKRQNVARGLLYSKRRYPGIPIFLPTRDVRSAFKLIPVSIRGLAYMG